MAGLQSLIQSRAAGQPGQMPGQMLNQMPGQAGAFTALPSPQGRNPAAYTRALKQIPPEDLIRIYNDPNDMRPKWAVASAYADAMKAKALKQGVMGQQAQAQNVAAQQTPPVADQVMAVMAASGGEMKAYAPGGNVEGDDSDIVAETDPQFGSLPLESVEDPVETERARIRTLFNYARQASNQNLMNMYLREHPWLAQEQRTPAAQPAAATPSPTGAPTAPGQTTPTATTPTATSPAAEAPDNLSAYARRLEEAENERNKVAREGATISPAVLAARQRMEQLSGRRLQQFQQDAEKIRSEGIRQLQGRLDAARRPLIDDPEALLSLAASINPQRGKAMGSMAQGLASILGQRRARAEKAEEGISALSEKVRLLNSQYQEAEALEEQRKYAILNQDANLKRETDQKIADNNVRMRQTQADIDIRLREAQARRDTALATRESAATSRAGIELNRLQVALNSRQKIYQEAKENWLNNSGVKLIFMQASASNPKPEVVAQWRKMQRDFDAAFKDSPDIRNLDAAITQMSRAAGVPLPSAGFDTSAWGQKVTVTPTPTN